MLDYIRRRLADMIARHNRIGPDVVVASSAWCSGSSLDGTVKIGEGCKVYGADIGGRVTIGRYTSLWGPGLHVIGRVHGISIGNFCSIARQVSIQEDYHNVARTTTYNFERNVMGTSPREGWMVSRGPIRIGSDVWIGAAAHN